MRQHRCYRIAEAVSRFGADTGTAEVAGRPEEVESPSFALRPSRVELFFAADARPGRPGARFTPWEAPWPLGGGWGHG